MDANTSLLTEAERVGYPFVLFGGSRHVAGEESWRRTVPTLQPGQLAEVATGLQAHVEQFDRSAASAALAAERAERRLPLTLEEERQALADRAAMIADAEAAHQRHVAGHPDRVEALLARILGALERRG